MPHETRQIILSDEELRQAVQSYRRMRSEVLPQGAVLGASVVRTGGGTHLNVTVRMRYGAGEHEVEVQVQEADLLALLVRFCLENNIPVPRRGEKKADSVGGAAALHIEFATELAAFDEA